MLRIPILLALISRLHGQILVDTFAGGAIPSGVPAQQAHLVSIVGTAWDPAGNVVFCDSAHNVIRRVRSDGILETIGGTGVSGYSGQGSAAAQALFNSPKQPQIGRAHV